MFLIKYMHVHFDSYENSRTEPNFGPLQTYANPLQIIDPANPHLSFSPSPQMY